MSITEAEKDWIESRRDEVSKILIESLKKLGHKNRPVISEVLHSTTLSSIHLSLTGSSLECVPRPQDITDSQGTQTSPHVTISHLSDIEIPDVPKLDIKSLYILRDGCVSQGLQCRYVCSACGRPKESSQSDFDDSISILSKDSTKPRSTSNTTLLTPIKKSEPQLNVTKSSETMTSSSLADNYPLPPEVFPCRGSLGTLFAPVWVHDDGSSSGGVLVISCTDPELVAERIQEEEEEKKREREARREEELRRAAAESSSGEGSKKKSSSEDELIMPPIALVRQPSNKTATTPLRNPVMSSVSATIAHEDERRASFGFKMNMIPSASPTSTTVTTEDKKKKGPKKFFDKAAWFFSFFTRFLEFVKSEYNFVFGVCRETIKFKLQQWQHKTAGS
eukprot:sb/3465494/